MALRVPWQDKYGFDKQAAIQTGVTLTNGVDTAVSGIALTNHPDLESGQEHLDTRKAIGKSHRRAGTGMEYHATIKRPVTTLEFESNTRTLALILWTLFQKGSIEAAGTPFLKFFHAYSDPACEVWLTIVRALAAVGTSESHRLIGAVANSLTLSAEEGGALNTSCEFSARDFEDTLDISTSDFTLSSKAPLLFQNAAVTMTEQGTTKTGTVYLPGFELTLVNNAIARHYDSNVAQRFVLGDILGSGTLRLPRDTNVADLSNNYMLDKFIAGTPMRLNIIWGAGSIAAADESLSLHLCIRYTGATLAELGAEFIHELPFELVQGYVYDTGTLELTEASATVEGSVTTTWATTNNVSIGDTLVIATGTNAGTYIIISITDDDTLVVDRVMAATEATVAYEIIGGPVVIGLSDDVDRTIP